MDIKDMCKHEVKTANGGLTGNKGSVALRFDLKDTSFMFMNCHLAPHDNSHMERMENLRKTISENFNVFFKNIDGYTLGHNYKCVFGDFNSRMNTLNWAEITEKIDGRKWEELRNYDQICVNKDKDIFLNKYSEKDISFAPTYKYIENSTEYLRTKKGKKKEYNPAWCDRILL